MKLLRFDLLSALAQRAHKHTNLFALFLLIGLLFIPNQMIAKNTTHARRTITVAPNDTYFGKVAGTAYVSKEKDYTIDVSKITVGTSASITTEYAGTHSWTIAGTFNSDYGWHCLFATPANKFEFLMFSGDGKNITTIDCKNSKTNIGNEAFYVAGGGFQCDHTVYYQYSGGRYSSSNNTYALFLKSYYYNYLGPADLRDDSQLDMATISAKFTGAIPRTNSNTADDATDILTSLDCGTINIGTSVNKAFWLSYANAEVRYEIIKYGDYDDTGDFTIGAAPTGNNKALAQTVTFNPSAKDHTTRQAILRIHNDAAAPYGAYLTQYRDVILTGTANGTTTFVFNGNNATSGSMANLSVNKGETKTLPTNGFARTGYSFTGWNTKADGTGTPYAYNYSYTKSDDANTTITLYAQWAAISYTVTYNGNGATSGSTANSTHTYDVAKNLSANGYARQYTVTYNYNGGNGSPASAVADYPFAGWAETDAGDKKYNDKHSVTNLASTQDAVVTLYAKWNPGSVTLPTPTRDGYAFLGWYSDSGLTNKVGDAGAAYTPTANVTLYAKWKAGTNIITFDKQGGNGGTDNVEATFDAAMPTITTPTRFGYTFNGYYDQTGGNGKKYYNADGTSANNWDKKGNQTLYAYWTANSVTIVFHSNNGNNDTHNQTATYNESTNLDANTFTSAWDEFEFIGWSKTDGVQDVKYSEEEAVVINETNLPYADGKFHLYAQWGHIHDDITFRPWLETTSLPTNGSWALVNNVVIDSLNIRNGEHLDLCLLGKTAQTKSYIAVVREAEFNLYDCEGNTGVLEVIADELTGKTRSKNVLFVNEGGVFNMYGGHIKNDLTLAPEIVPTIAIKSQNGKNGVANIYGGIIDRNERMCFGLDGKAQLNIYGGEIKDTYSDRDWGSSAAIWCCPNNNNGHTAFNGSVYIYGGKVSQANSDAHTFAICNQSLEKVGDNYAGGYVYYLAPAQVTDYALARTVVGSTTTPSVNAGMIAGPNLTLSQGYYTAEFVGTNLGGANYDVIQTGTTTRTFTLNTIPQSNDLVYYFTIPNEDWAIKDPNNTGLAETNENIIARLQTAADDASCTKVEIVRLYTYTYTLDKQGGSDGGDYAYYSVDNLNNGFFADPACLDYTVEIPTLEYYDFAGYFTQKNGKGDKIFDENGESLYQGKRYVWNPVDNFVLYAYWTPKKYNLKWNTNGGTIVSKTGEYTPEGLYAHGTTIVAPTVDKSCAVFAGWLPVNAEWKMPKEDVTYSAQWKEEFFIFDNNTEDGKWETPENWLYADEGDPVRSTSKLPTKYSQVYITAACVLSTEQHVGGIFVESEGKLTITPEGGLTIDECGMEGLTQDNFTLQSDADNGTGYVRMHPTYTEEKMPSATVQMYSKAYFTPNTDDPNQYATWQYIGTAVQTEEILGNLFYGDALEEWNEKRGNWDYCGNYDKMGIFKGYAYSQCKNEKGKIQTYRGNLTLGNLTITLACEGKHFEFTDKEQEIYKISANLGKGGFNLLANSFSAPIDATKFDLDNDFSGDDVDKTLYVYNTGSFNSWLSKIGEGKTTQFGVSVGQYINIPLGAIKFMDNPLLDVIPSMQAFFIQAFKPNAKINLNYERLIWDGDYVKHSNKPMRVAARNQEDADNGLSARIQITITGSGLTDKIYLLEGDNFSAEYDNGYDSRKLIGSKDVPQLYVKTAENKFAFFASDDINNAYIGLRTALSDSIIYYTFTFDGIIGDDYELYDSQLGIATPIYNGNSYSFTAEGGKKIEQRFVIRKKTSSNIDIENQYADKSAILLRHEGDFVKAIDNSGKEQTLEIIDAQGRLIMSESYTFTTTIDLSTLPAGTYMARTANEVLKIIK